MSRNNIGLNRKVIAFFLIEWVNFILTSIWYLIVQARFRKRKCRFPFQNGKLNEHFRILLYDLQQKKKKKKKKNEKELCKLIKNNLTKKSVRNRFSKFLRVVLENFFSVEFWTQNREVTSKMFKQNSLHWTKFLPLIKKTRPSFSQKKKKKKV